MAAICMVWTEACCQRGAGRLHGTWAPLEIDSTRWTSAGRAAELERTNGPAATVASKKVLERGQLYAKKTCCDTNLFAHSQELEEDGWEEEEEKGEL